TTDGGGAFSIQLPAAEMNQNFQVTANGAGLVNQTQSVFVGSANTEVSPFVVSGPTSAAAPAVLAAPSRGPAVGGALPAPFPPPRPHGAALLRPGDAADERWRWIPRRIRPQPRRERPSGGPPPCRGDGRHPCEGAAGAFPGPRCGARRIRGPGAPSWPPRARR